MSKQETVEEIYRQVGVTAYKLLEKVKDIRVATRISIGGEFVEIVIKVDEFTLGKRVGYSYMISLREAEDAIGFVPMFAYKMSQIVSEMSEAFAVEREDA